MYSPADFHASTCGWHLTAHAKQRAQARGVRIAQLLAAVTAPELSYPDPGNARHTVMTRGRLAVVVDARARTVLTVLLTGSDRWTDADARVVFATA